MRHHEIAALVLIALFSFGMSYLGAAVGLVLGQFRVVLITYVLGSAAVGAATSMAISTVSAISGVAGHARAGRVQIAPLFWIGIPSGLASYATARFADRMNPRIMKIAIALTLLIAAADLFRRASTLVSSKVLVATGRSGPPIAIAGTSVIMMQMFIGIVLGAVSGIVGLLLGSLRLPSMMRLGIKPAAAVGTNMAIGAITGLSAGISSMGSGNVNLRAFAIVAPLALLGAHLGAKQTGKLDPVRLTRWIATALLLTAVTMLGEAVTS